MLLRILLLTAALLPGFSSAEPVTLKCVTSEGRKAADLNIDLEKKVMARGLGSFDIVQEEGNYITAYQRIMSGGIGGEVFVLDRNTGEYQRGVVGVYYTEDTINKPNEKGSFGAWVYSGRCTKPQL